MTMYRDPAHYLRQLKTTKVPKRMLWLDCASSSAVERGIHTERWYVGALGTTHYTSRRGTRQDTLETYTDSELLWSVADEFCKPNRRVTLFAYDLAYQLRVSEALVHMPAMGWELDRIVLERTAAWALFRDGERSLLMCDLRSWMPTEFAQLAVDTGMQDTYQRSLEAGETFGAGRCQYRASIVREAVVQILNWIESEGLGGFKPTGSGQSYSAYRRRFLSHTLLVHDETDRLAVERQAMWTGRCEAWRHGNLTDGPYIEYDMQAAYCQIAAECDVPTIALHRSAGTTVAQLERAMQRDAVMADVTITTDVPVVPCKVGDRTMWPVGTFRTQLWDPELRLAIEYARAITCHRSWRYARAPALREFAQYVLEGMHTMGADYGMVTQRVLKHWSRCLVGRLGLKFRTWETFGHQDEPDLRLVTFADWDNGTQTDMLIAGHKRMILSDMQEATDSLPQIPGWVMSECRARLWHTMCDVGLGNVVYIDTDSIVTGGCASGSGGSAAYLPPDDKWSVKGTYSRMTIHGPRNLEAESSRRVSGVPLTARQVAPLEFTGEVMRSIKESMRNGELNAVAHLPRRFILDAPDLRREHLAYGATRPFHINQQPTQEDDL